VKRARAALVVFVVAAHGLSCSNSNQDKPPPTRVADENAALGGEIAARVGNERIPIALVQSVAVRQQVAPREAARRLIDDAIAAEGARAKGLDRAPPAAWLLVAARGRFTSDRIYEEARKGGPPTDDEMNALSERYWRDVDRPPAVRVVHAVATPTKPTSEEAARTVATAIRAAVAEATSAEDFLVKAKAVPTVADVKVTVQPLPAFTEEGWGTEDPNSLDPTFAKAAYSIPSIGGTSALVQTKFGFHVIRLVERVPALRIPLEARRAMFVEEAAKMRARESVVKRLEALRLKQRIEVSTAADTLMRAVPIRER